MPHSNNLREILETEHNKTAIELHLFGFDDLDPFQGHRYLEKSNQ